MAFIRIEDYYEFIAEEHLNQILEQSRGIEGDPDILAKAEEKAITRAKSYLDARFYTNRIFAEFQDFSISATYTWGDRVEFTATAYNAATVYTSTQLLSYGGSVYQKNATTSGYVAGTLPTNATFFDNRGEEGIYFIAYPTTWDADVLYSEDDYTFYKNEVYQRNATTGATYGTLPTDTNYFTRIRTSEYLTNQSVTAVWPTDAAWTQGDNRNGDVVASIIHMVLNKIHSIINPRNIPQLRRDNYTEALNWLKNDAQIGQTQVGLPERIEQEGYSIRFGSGEPTTHGY
jgi:hypothetical protein